MQAALVSQERGRRLRMSSTDWSEDPASLTSSADAWVGIVCPARYGFNPGSQLVLVGGTNSFAVSNAAVTTTLAPAAAGLSSLLTQAVLTHFSTGAAPAWPAGLWRPGHTHNLPLFPERMPAGLGDARVAQRVLPTCCG